MTKIKYSKGRLKISLGMGSFFVFIGIFLIILSLLIGELENISLISIGIGQIGAGVFMLLYFYYELKNQYLTIKNGLIKQNWPFGKKINLNDIKRIEKFAGDYILRTDKTGLIINTQLIDGRSLLELNIELNKLNLEWN